MTPGVPSAPSSSILYPILEAPASGTPLHPYLPLMLNSLAMFATIAMIHRYFLYLRLAQDKFGVLVQDSALVLIAVCLNLIGVVFTGLEHNLHIAATVACIYGLARFLDEDKIPAWFPAAIVIAPLLRYEGLALSMAAILVLALRKRWFTAAGTFLVIVLSLGGFSAFLMSLNLPPLPTSVLLKSDVAAAGVSAKAMSVLLSIYRNALRMDQDPIGLLLLLAGLLAAVQFFHEPSAKPWRWTSRGLMSLVLAFMVCCHAVAGQFGWFNRYEDYVVVGAALTSIYLAQNAIRHMLLNQNSRILRSSVAVVALFLMTARYIRGTYLVPLATNDIYEQQYQMHRFVNDFYGQSVASGNLGLIAYRNPSFVLDLGGLASEKVRLLMLDNANADAYKALVSTSGVKLVIIFYERPLQPPYNIPASWKNVATLSYSRNKVTADGRVECYAMDAEAAKEMQPNLRAFSKSLPPESKLTIYSPIQ
jgi:hypothetical protein